MKVEGPIWKARAKEANSKIMVKFSEADPVLGKQLFQDFNTWRSAEKLVQKRLHEYKTLEEYGRDRIEDLGWSYVISCSRLGNNIHLTEEEEASIRPVFLPLKYHVGYVNDYLSWEKELRHFEMSGGRVPLVNAVSLIMRWSGVSAATAKESLRQTCLNLDSEYFRLKKEYFRIHEDTMSASLRRWFDLFETIIAGNVWWLMMSYRHDISSDGSGYRDYYNKRCNEGAIWLEDCTKSEGFLSGGTEIRLKSQQPGQQVPSQLNGTHLVNGARQDVTNGAQSEERRQVVKVKPCEKEPAKSVLFTDPGLLISLDDHLVNLPAEYISSLPSKGIRALVVDALNTWYQVPNNTLETVKEVLHVLHNSSLMLDDIEDRSKLRRGKPATHVVFGPERTINSASFLIVRGLELVNKLSASAVLIYAEGLRSLHVGQAYDLHWTCLAKTPSEAEYLSMIDAKTSALFRLGSSLLKLDASKNRNVVLDGLLRLFGRYFQIRDDFQNLVSTEQIWKRQEA
ncbi:hypothetical protein PMG11_09924 [Penicillium brasilianum]|uniref:Geranylgeranyl pyrophosphate synthase n=1 Tax=Penicillium brasilianum TaxID=104259 RepID=A0A0F7TXH9_PENBI|nr:hypothetical protein PMG11_09924 [Penicillium brasilianum]